MGINPISDNNTNYEGDYSDFTDMNKILSENTSYTEVNISLSKIDTFYTGNEEGILSLPPASSKLITIVLPDAFDQAEGYFLTDNFMQINDEDQILTDNSGNIKLYWIDQGFPQNIKIACTYTNVMETISAEEEEEGDHDIIVFSQYEKVSEMVPFVYNGGDSINLTEGVPSLEPIEVIVKDSNGVGIEYIDVEIIPPSCDDNVGCPEFLWPYGVVSQTNYLGKASFVFTLENEGALTDNQDLDYKFKIENDNLDCTSIECDDIDVEISFSSTNESISFEIDSAVSTDAVEILNYA